MEYRAEVIWAKLGTMNVKRQMQEHCHACFQMYYMISGSACFVIGGQHIHVSEGSCFLIPPMVYHGMLPLEHNAAQCIEMKLVVNDPDLQKLLTAVPEPLSDIGPIRKQLLYAEANWNSRQPQTLRNIADILTALLLTFAADDLTSEIKPDSRHILTDGYSELTQSVFSYIERNYPHPFSLEDMGIALNYNKNYLCSAFRKNTGICIIDYLNFIRIRYAIICFAFYNQDVGTTCEITGFSNLSHFSRTFKARTGLSPSQFRRAFTLYSDKDIPVIFAGEPLLSYRRCTLDAAMKSLKQIGKTAAELLTAANLNSTL